MFLCVNTVSDKVVRHLPAYLSAQKMVSWGTSFSTWRFGGNWPTPFKNADFQSIFARSASAV